MSRSALWRQEGNVKARQQQAEELFNLAVEEGRNNRAKNLVPTWGPDDSFHFNPMLLENTIKSSYFQKCCRDVTDWNTLVDQIYYDVKHVEPWAQGSNREPSAAFCLLLRLLTLRCTEKQMQLLLDHPDSPYIRAVGFLFLRYACDPKVVFKWIQPYLYDEEQIKVEANSSKMREDATTVGEYVRRLFTDKNYYGTMLPRLPIQIERDIQVKMLQAEKIEDRAKKHSSDHHVMNVFKKLGSKVMALYGDDENPIRWYEAVVDRVITTDPETSQPLRRPKFVVTFPEYGNMETVSLGEMERIGATNDSGRDNRRGGFSDDREYEKAGFRGRDRNERDRSYDRSRGYDSRGYRGQNEHRGYGRQSGRSSYHDNRRDHSRDQYDGNRQSSLQNEDDLYEEVRRRERANVAASGRNAYARRPPSTKANLSGPSGSSHRRRPSPERAQWDRATTGRHDPSALAKAPAPAPQPAPKKRTAEEMAAIQEKKRKLLAKYG